MAGAAAAPGELEIQGIRPGHWLGFGFVCIAFAEFRRAVAAEQHYEELKGTSRAARVREGIAHPDIARRVFDEFYSSSAQ